MSPENPHVMVYYKNEVTGQMAGPFLQDGVADSVYSHAGNGWLWHSTVWADETGGVVYGDTGGLLEKNGPIPNPFPLPFPLPNPDDGGKVHSPDDAPPGSVFVMERFTDTLTNTSGDWNNRGCCTWLVGSDKWQALSDNPGRYRPSDRQPLHRGIFYDNVELHPTAYVTKDGHPVGVPASTETAGHYDCWHIGRFNYKIGTQAEWDSNPNNECGGKDIPDDEPPLVPPPLPDKDCGFYDCPSNHGTGECCHNYSSVFESIRNAIQNIADKMAKTTTDACDISDRCIDQITEKIWKRLNANKTQCKKCCDYIERGVAMSSEDAYVCSNLSCDCAEKHCGPVSEGGDGTPCDVGVWHVYCDPSNSSYRVTQDDNGAGFGELLIGEYETEREANDAGKKYCVPQEQQPEQPPIPEPSPPNMPIVGDVCDLNNFASPAGIQSLVGSIDSTVVAVYASDIILQTMRGTEQSLGYIPLVGTLVGAIEGAALSKTALARAMQPYIAGLMGCGSSEAESAATAIAAAATIQEYTGVAMSEFCPHLAYALHASCRNKQMSPGESIEAYLYGNMPKGRIDTHFAIAGYCDDVAFYQLDVLRKKLSPLDLATLRHREKLSPSEYNTRIRQLGYINESEANEIYELTNQIPPPSDIIRMMVRDADDPQIAATFHTDDGFAKKYNKQLKKWAKDQGVSDLAMQYLWRSHWSIPSPGQLFTINHRLRHDAKWNADGKLFEKIEAALVQQDVLPFWIPYLTATSFRPMTRVDTRRAFNIGALDEQGVLKSYWDQGYSDENADALLKFTIKLRDQSASTHRGIKLWQKASISADECRQMMAADGLPQATITKAMRIGMHGFASSWPVKAFINGDLPADACNQKLRDFGVDADAIAAIMAASAPNVRRHPILVRFSSGNVDRATALGAMTVYGMLPDRANRMLDSIEFKFHASQSLACQHAIKQRFLLGELDDAGTSKILIGQGVVKERADDLLDHWQCEKSAIGRAVPGQTLCEWLSRGVLNPQDFIKRLTNIGYTKDDAAQMFVDCQGNINQKQAAEALKQAKAQASAIKKQEDAAKKAMAQLEKEQAQLERNRKTAQAANLRRRSALNKAAEKLYAKVDADLDSVLDKINLTNRMFIDTMALSADEAVEAVLRGAETFREGTLDDYVGVAEEFAQALIDEAIEGQEPDADQN